MTEVLTVDRDKRWEEIQALSLKVASKAGTPTEVESALCGAVVRARDWLEQLEELRETISARSHARDTYGKFGTLLPLGERPKETDAEINAGALRHERRVVGHASGWQEQMDTCICGKPWPCSSAVSTTRDSEPVAWVSENDLAGAKWGRITGAALSCKQEGDRVVALYRTPPSAMERKSGPLKLDTDRQVFFYEQDHYYLSNFSAFTLFWMGRVFSTSEHAYQWSKFPHLPELQDQILLAPSAHEAFKIAERNSDKRRTDWLDPDLRVAAMRAIVEAKVTQHEYVRRKLLMTGNRELIENSWRDPFWGWGPNRDGKNMLGRVWMAVRSDLAAGSPFASTDGGAEARSDALNQLSGPGIRKT